jgi:hypothetical protein
MRAQNCLHSQTDDIRSIKMNLHNIVPRFSRLFTT